MFRAFRFRPTVTHLEERAVPGSVLTSLDLSAALGSTLTLTLDQTTAAPVVASAGAPRHQPTRDNNVVDVGDQPVLPPSCLDPQNLPALPGVSAVPVNDLGGSQGQNNPPPPARGTYVNLGFLPGSYLQIDMRDPIPFGSDPPTDGWQHVFINQQGHLRGHAPGFHIDPYTFTASSYHITMQLEALSKLTGSYSADTGITSASVTLDVHLTSTDAPLFDNTNCKIPAMMLHFSPNPDTGVLVDNTFDVPAIPRGTCGGPIGVEYATALNAYFGLPSPSGSNTLALNVAITPVTGP